MRIPSGTTDQYIYFVAVDSTDFTTRETGLSSFTVYRSRNGAAAAAMSSPTTAELSSSNLPGVYSLLLDEDMTIAAGNDTEEMVFHITKTGMAPVTRTIELYRPKITEGYTLGVNSSGHVSRVVLCDTTTTNTDQRGTDSAFLAASAPSNFSSLGINASGHISRVTLCDTTTANTDMRGTDSGFLAASAPTNFGDLAITASTGRVTVGTNNDKTGYSISGSKTTLDALNDIAATAIVSAGAITTLSGAVVNVDTVDTCTTNTDMRGTDSAFLAASAPSNFSSLGINASGHVSRVTLCDTTTTNTDAITVAAVADGVWDESLSAHNGSGSTGKALKQMKDGIITIDGSVNDSSATTTTFVANLSSAVDGFYHDKVIVFVSGDLSGQARHIETYTGSTKSITVSQAFTSAPANSDEFLILATHEHSLGEIADGVWDELQSGHTVSGSFGEYLDAQVSEVGGGSLTVSAIADGVWDEVLSGHSTSGTAGLLLSQAGGGSGNIAGTITITDGSSPIDGANVDITTGSSSNTDGLVASGTTNVSGEVTFNLSAGTYYQWVQHASYSVSNPTTLTVS